MGYIGEKEDLRTIELEPMPDDIPAPEIVPAEPIRTRDLTVAFSVSPDDLA